MGNSASSQGSSTGTHDGDVGSSISEERHDWPIEQAADEPDVQSLQEMRKPYSTQSYCKNYLAYFFWPTLYTDNCCLVVPFVHMKFVKVR